MGGLGNESNVDPEAYGPLSISGNNKKIIA
jgi:hypothetical protein